MKNILIILSVLLLVACAKDQEDKYPSNKGQQSLKIMTLTPSFAEVQPMTRAGFLPDTYINYASLIGATNPQYANIGIFMVPDRSDPSVDYVYQEIDEYGHGIDSWISNIYVTTGTQYYMYGFMPGSGAAGATITSLNGTGGDDFANGANIHIEDFASLTPADVSVIVGVRKATDAEIAARAPLADVKLGAFGFEAGEKDHNSVFILLKHIYSGIRFRAVIDATYHELRDIKITKVDLIVDDIAPTVDLDILLTANGEGNDPMTSVTYTEESAHTQASISLFPWEGSLTEYQLQETEPSYFLGCFVPSKVNAFTIRTRYNVYDKEGNLIRENCVAENKINSSIVPSLASIKAGEVYTITCTVKPTYLYVLSNPDLDNPTFIIE